MGGSAKLKILLIGSHGTIGSYLREYFLKKHEIVTANRSGGDFQVDIADEASIIGLCEQLGSVDAIVVAAGEAKWDAMENLTEDDYYIGIRSKLMGQVNIVRHGGSILSPGGSITLTTGILADDPVYMTTSAAMVNGAIHSFARAAAIELRDGKRINVVCPGLVKPSVEKYADYFPGHYPVTMDRVALGYSRSVEGRCTGEVIKIY